MKIQAPSQYETEVGNLKCIFYGQTGAGKTTLASSFPSPLIIDLEGGLGKNRPYRATIEKYSEIEELVQALKTQSFKDKFKTVCIDSLNELVEILIRDEVLTYETKRLYSDQLTQGDYGKIGRDIPRLIRKMIYELGDHYHLIFLCAENQISYEGEQRSISVVGKMILEQVPRLMDIVGCVFTKGNDHLLTINNSSFAIGKNRYGVSAAPFKFDKDNGFEKLLEKISEE